jgi:galactokinase
MELATGALVDAADLAAWFGERFGAPPRSIWRAPGRVNLIGEHTDYNQGLVLPFALERGVLTAAAVRQDAALELQSRQRPDEPVTIAAGQLRPGTIPGWAGYVAGCAWALEQAGYPVGGLNVAVDSDLPMGAGLASSAALTCSVLSALTASPDRPASPGDPAGPDVRVGPANTVRPAPTRTQIAALAQRAESEFVGVPCGIMDQSAAMLCRAGHALLLDCSTGESAAVPLDLAGAGLRLLVIDTGVRHALADGQYAARRRECEQAASLLGVGSLREVTEVASLAGLPEAESRRARHVVTENLRVVQVAGLLRDGRLPEIGDLLSASHTSLRDDFEVSWPAADLAVEAALTAGALGARMIGGGFGGCVIALLPAGQASAVRAAIDSALGADKAAAPAYLEVEPADGARQVWPA